MIQQNEISKLLKATLTSTTNFKGVSISLLSKLGNQLITITTTTEDQLKIYSLIAYNSVASTNLEWNIIEFNELKCIIQKISNNDNSIDSNDEEELTYYVTLFYLNSSNDNGDDGDAIAKLKVDNLSKTLKDGLKGYVN
ncbi:hypothetical protein KGF54_005612 [Candida jiufengensis]|uniref:uncharacterized protein n=1 Tax=Candida jiufengensis TaxID=497108 RepID=UPI002224F821|nr:uncharacterized protein KGF54_005612 [Candida jiufengensis]KAI5949377.1 hypothetical protein KGF54_005612 [Candida jiufengensis]